jgi:hypothetical protein
LVLADSSVSVVPNGGALIGDRSGEEPDCPCGPEVTNRFGLVLHVNDDGILTGEIMFNCSVGPCGTILQSMRAINDSSRVNIEFSFATWYDPFFADANLYLMDPGRDRTGQTRWSERDKIFSFGTVYYDPEILIRPGYASTPTVPHELGHLLGFRHRRNSTGSVMSYAENRNANFTNDEISRLIEAYR